MAGFKENVTSLGVTIQPTAGVYNEPTLADLIAVSQPDNGSDAITAEDATLTGAVWNAPRQFLGTRGRAGATFSMRGPGGAVPPGAGEWVPGRILQATGFTEVINSAAITGTATGGSTSSIQLAAAASAIDDFFMGYPIQHPTIGTGRVRGTSLIRDYIGATKTAILSETLATAIAAGTYTIPPFLGYILSTAASVPLLSAAVWRHKKKYGYRDCAVSSFAINVPVNNDQTTDVPTIEFGLVGVPVPQVDQNAPVLPSKLLTPVPPAKGGKFTFNGVKRGHQTLRIEFGLESGAPPNQNFDAGQEGYELLSGTRSMTADLNEQLVADLDIQGLVERQDLVPVQSGWGTSAGQTFLLGLFNSLLDPFNPQPRNGFVGIAGGGVPNDADRALSLIMPY
jgi:hypothetical protein